MMNMERFETKATVFLRGENIDYRTVCEDYPVYAQDGTLVGTMFSYTYLRTNATEIENRPVLFAYNGGPGSSALWLQTGLLAPKRVKLEDPLNPNTLPPFELEVNQDCLLDVCDIVIIDPLGTGFSKIIDIEKQKEAYSVEQDALIFSQFIQWWLEHYNRKQSPKYLLGESYGTTRSCVLANILMGGPTSGSGKMTGITLDGMILMGTALFVNPESNFFTEGRIDQMMLDLPTMAAVNWYHHREGKPELSFFLKETRDFIVNDCLKAYYLGESISDQEKKSFIEKLAYYTGLSQHFLVRNNFRVSMADFSREILGEENLIIGMYDGRYTMPYIPTMGADDPVSDESAMGAYTPAYRGAFMRIAKEELGIELDREFNIINFHVNGMWNFESTKTPFACLQSVIRRNPEMRILFSNGQYDLITTIGQARYTANHLKAGKGQIIVKEYSSGHMTYVDQENRRKLCSDLREFITKEK